MLEITTVQISLTLYCKAKFSSRFINYIRLTYIFIIFWNAVFKPGYFIRHDLDVVVVVDGIFLGVERHIGWALWAVGCWAALAWDPLVPDVD